MDNGKTIAIVGLGYVGLPLALLADRKGYHVIGVDVNAEKVDAINKRIPPFVDHDVAEQLKSSSLDATTDFGRIKDAFIVIICVPTPIDENNIPDLRPVEGACRSISPFLQKGQVVVLESTVNPGVSESIVLPLLEKGSGLTCGKDFHLAHCPERINPGDKKWNVANISRVIGSFDEMGLQKAIAFYTSIIGAEIKPMASLKEAEAVKIVENAFRDINIAFVNELAMSFARLGIDVVNVIQGAATKPFAFMPHFPGCGVGGHCIPVDPYYLIEHAKQNGFQHEFLSLARRINNSMPEFTASLAVQGLQEVGIGVKGAKIAVLGLAYKAEIGDYRESPSFEIIKALEGYGADVIAYDPFVIEKSTVTELDDALKDRDAIIIATAHNVFKALKPDHIQNMGVKVVIDGRNCLAKEGFVKAGMVYKGIGR